MKSKSNLAFITSGIFVFCVAVWFCKTHDSEQRSLTVVLPISILCAVSVQMMGAERQIARLTERIEALEAQSSD